MLRELLAHSGELQGAVPAGRRDRPERDRADEPAARQNERRLRQHRRLVEALDRRGRALLPASTSRPAARRAASPRSRRAVEWRLDPEAAYVHICANETIGGVEYHWTPDTGDVPLVADMSSNILSRPIDVARYGLIYGGAQKNIGPAGLTFVIVREDLLGRRPADHAGGLRLQHQAANDSMINTPPTFADLPRRAGVPLDQGGRRPGGDGRAQPRQGGAALRRPSTRATSTANRIARDDRSLMNVAFQLRRPGARRAFPRRAPRRAGLIALKGHRLVGGMRASLYNAMPIEGVQALVAYMKDFEARRGLIRLEICIFEVCMIHAYFRHESEARHGSDRRRARPDHAAQGGSRRPRPDQGHAAQGRARRAAASSCARTSTMRCRALRGRFKLAEGVHQHRRRDARPARSRPGRSFRRRTTGPTEASPSARNDRRRLVRAGRPARRRRRASPTARRGERCGRALAEGHVVVCDVVVSRDRTPGSRARRRRSMTPGRRSASASCPPSGAPRCAPARCSGATCSDRRPKAAHCQRGGARLPRSAPTLCCSAARLITRDAGFFRDYFKGLKVIEPKAR